jgi:hypothetical protein
MSTWLGHPVLGYEMVAQGIRDAIAGPRPKKLERPGDDLLDAYDRLPAPSLIGARRTVGELRLITNATPQGRWQQVVRLRALMDFYNAERLEPDSPGVLLVAELGAQLKALGVPAVAIIPPLNHEVIVKTLGAKAREHVERNAAIIQTAFQDAMGEMGTVVNAVVDCPATEFIDPLHLSEHGRGRLAARISEAVRPYLDDGRGAFSSARGASG